jgi:5-methylcytosine-specific restriction endonuclease McrA
LAVSVRTRFEVFKRDDFTCQYCGRKSPDVVLEADHIVPHWNWLFNALTWCPAKQIQNFMDLAILREMTDNLSYVAACCRNWREENAVKQK